MYIMNFNLYNEMKKLLFVFALMLAGLSSALAQTKVMYAEISETNLGNPNDLTITFRAVDSDKVPEQNYNSTTGVGIYRSTAYAIIKDKMVPKEGDIGFNITKAVFEPSVAEARPKSTNYLLGNMPNLTTVEGIEYLNTSEVLDMSYMFRYDQKLKDLDVSHFNTEKVQLMGTMFYNCSALEKLDVSGFKTENVTDMAL